MSTLVQLFLQLGSSIQSVWKNLSKHIDKDTAKLVFITLTVLLIFESVLVSLLIALAVLHSFLS